MSDSTAWSRLGHRQILLLMSGLMTGLLLAALDQTIVGTALPTIVGELGGLNHYSWVVTSYLLAATASTPLYGKISDMIGRRPVFLFAIGTFIVGSLLAGLSRNMTELILFRGVQGLGAGGLMTLAFTIISDVVSPRERGRYQGLFGAVFGVSSVAGPLLGGYFAEYNWRWIFYVNVPLGALAIVVSARVLRLVARGRRRHRLDWLGAALMVSAVTCLLLGLSWGGVQYPWSSATIIALLAAGALLGVLFLLAEARASEPILPLTLFRRASFAVGNATGFVIGFAMFGAIIFIPLYLQIVKGASPTASGLLMLPMMAAVIVASILSGQAMSRIGRYKWFPVAGSALLVVGMLLLSGLRVGTPLWVSFGYLVVIGVGLGLCMQSLILAVQNSVEPYDLGAATAAATFFRSLGGSFGVAILGAVLSARLTSELAARLPSALTRVPPEAAQQFAGGGTRVSINEPSKILALPGPIRAVVQRAFVEALDRVFLVGAVVGALAVVLTLTLPDHRLRGAAPRRRWRRPAARPARGLDLAEEAGAEAPARAWTIF